MKLGFRVGILRRKAFPSVSMSEALHVFEGELGPHLPLGTTAEIMKSGMGDGCDMGWTF